MTTGYELAVAPMNAPPLRVGVVGMTGGKDGAWSGGMRGERMDTAAVPGDGSGCLPGGRFPADGRDGRAGKPRGRWRPGRAVAVIGGGGSGFHSGTVDGPLPLGVVPTVADVARMYDYLLGRYFASTHTLPTGGQ